MNFKLLKLKNRGSETVFSRNLFLSFLLSFAFGNLAFSQTSLNDVTLLLPLPQNLVQLKASYLNSSTVLSSGALVSSNRLKLFDWTTVQADLDLSQRANIERLAVLGIRLDPCFKDQFTDNCRPQIRLVLQPIDFAGTAVTAADVGIHLFFDTSRDQILQLIRFARDYRNQFLGTGSWTAPLQVNPVIQQESVNGKFWQNMRPLIQNVLNQATPSRIAFFVVEPSGRQWSFRSFDLNGANSTPIQIPGVNTPIQRIDNQIQNSTIEFLTSPNLLPRASFNSDQTFDYLSNSVNFRSGGLSRTSPLLNSLERIENPGLHLPGTIDCLSCHSSPAIKSDLRKNQVTVSPTVASFISKTFPTSSLLNLFENNYQSRDFRLLGYRDSNPVLGQRVINESASIVDSLGSF